MNLKKIIFQELPEGIDETWTHGALFGGMASVNNNFDLARAFRIAGESLVMRNTKDIEAYEILCPVLYIYRHAIELYLKAIISKSIPAYNVKELSHDLKKAFSLVNELVVKQSYDMPEKARLLVHEFAELDKKSFLFRYGEGFRPGEYWIDFVQLNHVMGWLFDGFEKIYHLEQQMDLEVTELS